MTSNINEDLACAGNFRNTVKVNPHLYYNHNYMISNMVLCEI